MRPVKKLTWEKFEEFARYLEGLALYHAGCPDEFWMARIKSVEAVKGVVIFSIDDKYEAIVGSRRSWMGVEVTPSTSTVLLQSTSFEVMVWEDGDKENPGFTHILSFIHNDDEDLNRQFRCQNCKSFGFTYWIKLPGSVPL